MPTLPTRVSALPTRLMPTLPTRPSALLPVRVSIAALGVAAALLTGCPDSGKAEASSLVRIVDDLRSAPNDAKRAPLDRLRAAPCTAPDVCAVRDACVDAFSHHVRATDMTAEIRKRMEPGPAPLSGPDREDLARKLLEANIELEQGKELMAACDSRTTDLRIRRKL